MAAQLNSSQRCFFCLHGSRAVAVADRYPKMSLPSIPTSFAEAGAGMARQRHILNDRPYRITRGDLFYIRAETNTLTPRLTIWCCRTLSTAGQA